MNDQDFRKLLEKLQNEIEQTESDDEKGRELLHHLSTDIRVFLKRPESEKEQPEESLVERLNDAIDHFEITHPALTTMLSQMLNILNNAGI